MDSPKLFCNKHDEPVKNPKPLSFRAKREILHMLLY